MVTALECNLLSEGGGRMEEKKSENGDYRYAGARKKGFFLYDFI